MALYLVKHHFFNSLLRAGSKLIGLLLEPVKADLPLLGSEMTLASLQAWGQRLSSRLRLKILQIGVPIESATVLSSFPSKLSMPGGLSLLIDNNNCFHLSHTNFTKFKLALHLFNYLLFYTWVRWLTVRCWLFLPKFAHFANVVTLLWRFEGPGYSRSALQRALSLVEGVEREVGCFIVGNKMRSLYAL